MLTEILTTLSLVPIADFPDVQPDYSAPFMTSILKIAAWVLGVVMAILFVTFAVCLVLIGMRGAAPERARTWAVSSVGWVFLAAAAAGSLGGIFAWMISFDLGF